MKPKNIILKQDIMKLLDKKKEEKEIKHLEIIKKISDIVLSDTEENHNK